MLKRKILNKLITWKTSENKVALLIKGARQVGKTTIVREFAKKNYTHFIEINFERSPLVKNAFAGNLDARTIILNLSAMGFGPFVEGETLVFFDEIQSCPNARTAIKFLVEDGRFDYIESGSLLGINYKDVSSYPVGFEEQINMYPLDFEEFLWAQNVSGDVITKIKEAYEQLKPVPSFIHEMIMKNYREYLIVGGMPKVVSTFISNDDFNQTIKLQRNILNGYRDDISKYAGKDKILAKAIFDAIPEQLNQKNKRFILASLEEGASSRKYGDASMWLSDAGIGYQCFNVTALELPLAFSAKRNLYKLYMVDSGLLCAHSLNNIQQDILNGNIAINEGAITENAIATELTKKGIPLYYYDKKSRAELDFIIRDGDKISVIEVKSGKDYKKHAALDNVIKERPEIFQKKIVLCNSNVELGQNGIYYLPLYMSMFIQ